LSGHLPEGSSYCDLTSWKGGWEIALWGVEEIHSLVFEEVGVVGKVRVVRRGAAKGGNDC
jgi:hypothetical protein